MNTSLPTSLNSGTPTNTLQATTMEVVQESQIEYAKEQHLEDIVEKDSVPSQLLISSSSKPSQSLAKRYEVVLKPRGYQVELAQPGIEGKNYIVVAPTNSGKTLVAALVIADHLEKKSVNRPPKVVVVVKTRTLADQQTDRLGEYIPNARVECRTGNRNFSRELQLHIQDALPNSDVIVCTAGKLLDELKKEMVALQEISLMIIDECHNTERNSNYAQIMHFYLEQKEQEATKCQLPQVVGLTATPGMGNNPSLNPTKAVDNLISLCAYMDANAGIQTVQINTDELNKFVTKPKDYLDLVNQSKEREGFIQRLEEEMKESESFLSISTSHCNQSPRWSQQYLQMVKEKKIAVEESPDTDDRDKVSTARLLECYTQTLVNYIDLPCESDQIMNALENYDDLRPSASHVLTDHEKRFLERFERLKIELSNMPKYENPILEKLEKRLTEAFKGNPKTAGIVFVRTREQAETINDWISDSEFANLVGIKSEMLIGHSRSATGPHMSDDDQRGVVEQFRKSECNILVATSVAEEGLDIKRCNLVMRLHISSAKSKAQMQGRARAEDSEIVTIVSDDPKKRYKDMYNDELLILIKRLIQNNCLPSADKLPRKIAFEQKMILEKVMKERELEKARVNSYSAGDVELRCIKCKMIVCSGSDIYVIDKTNHHVVLKSDFAALYELVDHQNPGPLLGCYEPVIEKENKIHCINCNQSWGALGKSSNLVFPLIKCESFSFFVGGKPKRFRQWKNRPFKVSLYSEWLANNKANDVIDSEQGTSPSLLISPHSFPSACGYIPYWLDRTPLSISRSSRLVAALELSPHFQQT